MRRRSARPIGEKSAARGVVALGPASANYHCQHTFSTRKRREQVNVWKNIDVSARKRSDALRQGNRFVADADCPMSEGDRHEIGACFS